MNPLVYYEQIIKMPNKADKFDMREDYKARHFLWRQAHGSRIWHHAVAGYEPMILLFRPEFAKYFPPATAYGT